MVLNDFKLVPNYYSINLAREFLKVEAILRAKVRFFSKVKILKNAFNKK